MERDKIIFLRNFFFCAFIIGLVFTLFYFIATYAFWDTASQWAVDFYKVDEKEFGRIVLTFFTNVRLVLVFLFLVPALAFHLDGQKKIVKSVNELQGRSSHVTGLRCATARQAM